MTSLITKDVKRALIEARNLAVTNVIEARIPECGDFGAIAQNLDYACNELEQVQATELAIIDKAIKEFVFTRLVPTPDKYTLNEVDIKVAALDYLVEIKSIAKGGE